MSFDYLSINAMAMGEAEYSAELIVVWTYDIDMAGRVDHMAELFWSAKIGYWFPDEVGSWRD